MNWIVPLALPSNSDHQDYYIFSRGLYNIKLHLPLLLGKGMTQIIYQIYIIIYIS